jgi:hypothetical protein
MYRVCSWCIKEGRDGYLGEKAPFENPKRTDGICPVHLAALTSEIAKRAATHPAPSQ